MDWKLGGLNRRDRQRGNIRPKLAYGLLGAFVLALMLKGCAPASDPAPTTAPPPVQPESRRADLAVYEACEAAIREVKARLKSPASADFPDCVFSANEYEVRAKDDRSEWAVSGHVDSQNSYGAMLRSRFVVFLVKKHDRGPSGYVARKVVIE